MPDVFVLTLIACWLTMGECVSYEATFPSFEGCVRGAISKTVELRRDGAKLNYFDCTNMRQVEV